MANEDIKTKLKQLIADIEDPELLEKIKKILSKEDEKSKDTPSDNNEEDDS